MNHVVSLTNSPILILTNFSKYFTHQRHTWMNGKLFTSNFRMILPKLIHYSYSRWLLFAGVIPSGFPVKRRNEKSDKYTRSEIEFSLTKWINTWNSVRERTFSNIYIIHQVYSYPFIYIGPTSILYHNESFRLRESRICI